MNIFIYEFKMYLRSIITWSLVIFALLFIFMSFYPTFSRDAAMMDLMLRNYPPEYLKAFGMDNGLSMSTVNGYFAFLFIYIQLSIAIQSSYYGFHFLSVEEREMTADFLMCKPVSRTKIIVSKFLAALTSVTIINIFIWIGSFLSIMAFKGINEFDPQNLKLLLLITPVFQLFFLSVGMVISVALKKIKSVISFSMALAFGLFALNSLRDIIGGKVLGLLTPFYHFEPGYILANGHYDVPLFIISAIIIIISLTGSYVLYLKRNIHSV